MVAGGATRGLVEPRIEFERGTSLWQQECEEGMFNEPHSAAMCLQHWRSGGVISSPGITQAITGMPAKMAISNKQANWRAAFTAINCSPFSSL